MRVRPRWKLKTLVAALVAQGSLGYAAPPLPAGTVPLPAAGFVSSGQATANVSGSTLTVNQATARAILNWQSFNVSRDAAVRFVQPGASSAALNRIHDANPSVIQGQVTANGQIYLINRNGIVFDQGAQINASALVASTLNIRDEDFEKGLLSIARNQPAFAWDGGASTFRSSFVRVENGAELRTPAGGQILVFAPNIVNNGLISTPEGQTVLAAGAKVYLSAPSDATLRGFLVEVDPYREQDAGGNDLVNIGGTVLNDALGRIVTERGNTTLAGLAVNQSGRVTASTSVRLNGSVMLLARDTAQTVTVDGVPVLRGKRGGELKLGAGSVTEVLPERSDAQTIQDAQSFTQSSVDLFGRTIALEDNSAVVAPGGVVTLTAQEGSLFQNPGLPAVDGVRIYLGSGSRIDVAGSGGVLVPMERNFIQVELRGDELKDSPLQRGGVLRGQKVTVDIRQGTPLADISGYLAQVGRTVGERTAEGGSIRMHSEGDIVLREGSVLDVSGGSLRYLGGIGYTTKLRGADGRVYDIGSAPADQIYSGFADIFVVRHAKWGVTETFRPLQRGQFIPGYAEGKDAGAIDLLTHFLVMDGTLLGRPGDTGPYQRDAGKLPLGGLLTLGDATQAGAAGSDFRLSDVAFTSRPAALPEGFTAGSVLDVPWRDRVEIGTGIFGAGGFSRAAVYSNGAITIPEDVAIAMAPGGSLALTGRQIDVRGDVSAPGGSIALTTRETVASVGSSVERYAIDVGPASRLSVRGLWVNDAGAQLAGTGPIVIDGGRIGLSSAWSVELAPGSVLDVSGGGYLSRQGQVTAGDAGSIAIASGRAGLSSSTAQTSHIALGSELLAYALGDGGELSLSTSRLTLGGAPLGAAGELFLAESFFLQGGFAHYTLNGQDGVRVSEGAQIAPVVQNLLLGRDYLARPTGSNLDQFTQRVTLPQEKRSAAEITLKADSTIFGELVIGERAAVRVDPTGGITLNAGRQLTVLGTLAAPAGSISLSTSVPGNEDTFDSTQSIWLGSESRLLANGFTRRLPDARGLITGDVLDGGTVTIAANRGYVIAEAGSLIDVSGASGVLDVRALVDGREQFVPTLLASNAGSISISAREGILLDGDLRARTASGAAAGALTVSLAETPRDFFPNHPQRVILRETGASIPAGLRPGDTVDPDAFSADPQLNGRAFVSAAAVRRGGFDTLTLRAREAIEIQGDLDLALRQNLQLDAPILRLGPGSDVSLAAAYVLLGNTNPELQAPRPASGGDGQLNVRGRLIDLAGRTALQGAQTANFTSLGDIRLRGVVVDQDPGEAFDFALVGALTSGGDLSFTSAQLYPTTLSEFALAVEGNPDGTIAFRANGTPGTVLSAAGDLSVSAPVIRQEGVVKAPFGTLRFNAGRELDLAAGSRTSVSGEGQVIPFGRTELSGIDYVYAFGDGNRIFKTPPEKQILLDGKSITIEGRVDVSGGGDLYAYEFTPGPGGSKDVLDPSVASGTYAILPWLDAQYAPFDHQYYLGTAGQVPGERVYLTGVSGLRDGAYTLMPARYGLLPGAYLVKPVAGKQDFLPTQTVNFSNGAQLVSGYRLRTTLDGGVTRDARLSAFEVRSASVARTQSEYRDSQASRFFDGTDLARLPGDAGRLAITATQSLALQGTVSSATQAGRRGAEVDITAPKLAVVSARGTAGAGFLEITIEDLERLGASSLLLGGTRTAREDGLEVRAGNGAAGSEVLIANDAGSKLSAPEVMLAATGSITLRDGAAIEAQGAAGPAPGSIHIEGDGAFLRASSGAQATVVRSAFARTAGTLNLGATTTVAASQSIILDATQDTLIAGSAVLQAPALSISAGRVSFGDAPAGTQGLVVSQQLLAQVGEAKQLGLKSYSSLDFYGAVELGGLDATSGAPLLRALVLDAAGIAGYGSGDKTIRAADVVFSNSSAGVDAPFASTPTGSGALLVTASSDAQGGGHLTLGTGAKQLEGFSTVSLRADQEVAGNGSGSLAVAGDLTVDAARMAGATGSDQRLSASGAVDLQAASAALDAPATGVGARLSVSGTRVTHAGRIELPSGQVLLEATGAGAGDGVTLAPGALIDVSGTRQDFSDTRAFTPGGAVELTSRSGQVSMAAGSTIDVSGAADGGHAGTLAVSAARGAFLPGGTLAGAAREGYRSGSIVLDTGALADFSALNARLNAGGFAEQREIRVRTGGLTVGADDAVVAQHVALAADGGAVDVLGSIDASGANGGSIEIWARDGVALADGSRLSAAASAADGRGGQITLGTQIGSLDLRAGSAMDVSGDATQGGRQVLLRAPRAGADVAVTGVHSAIVGAREIVLEAFKVYSGIASIGTTAGTGRLTFTTVANDNTAFMANANAIETRLGVAANPLFHVRPGVEVRSDGDLALANDWNLFSTTRPGGEPGVLTLRAAGDLNLNGSLSDGFNGVLPTSALQSGASWSYRLAGGADAAAADPRAVRSVSELPDNVGDVTLAAGKLVRTGTGFIQIDAGRNVELKSVTSVVYTAGVPGPVVAGFTNPSLTGVPIPVFPTGGGDISIRAREDVIGAPSDQLISQWLYRDAKRTFAGVLRTNPQTAWWSRLDQFQQGIGAFGGGDIHIQAGGDVDNVSAVIPTNGRLGGSIDAPANAANLLVQGGGDLVVEAGGNIRSGLFLVGRGDGRLSAGDSIVAGREVGGLPYHTVLAVGEGTLELYAARDLTIETVLNPTVLRQSTPNLTNRSVGTYFFTYGDSSVDLTALTGTARLDNSQSVLRAIPNTLFSGLGIDEARTAFVYPGSVRAVAFSGNVEVGDKFNTYPSSQGGMQLLAGGSVLVQGLVAMSDVSPASLPLPLSPDTAFGSATATPVNRIRALLLDAADFGAEFHSNPPLFFENPDPVRVVALGGDIVGPVDPFGVITPSFAILPKSVVVEAGRDVRDVWLIGQNLLSTDVTRISAGRNVVFTTLRDASGNQRSNAGQIVIGGPGDLIVTAGRNIDLGNSAGIVTRGNISNPFLPEQGAAIRLSAGGASAPDYAAFITRYLEPAEGAQQSYLPELTSYMRARVGDPDLTEANALAAFRGLSRDAQTQFVNHILFAELRQAGRDFQSLGNYDRGYEAIATLFPAHNSDGSRRSYDGDVNLFFSQIKTEQGGDIEIRVPGGLINAGLANPGNLAKGAADLGIVTVRGGTIRAFTNGDFLVNQSRVFTLQGGDILLWSSEGNIDAGKGAKTASATPPPQLVFRDGKFILDTSRSIEGSGIGVLLGKEGIPPGDVDLIAPRGEVSAGDAGIRVAGNLNIAALRVVGAENIQVGGVSSGVPVTPSGSIAASLGGVSDVAATASKAAEQATQALASNSGDLGQKSYIPSFITVEVLGLGDEEEERKAREAERKAREAEAGARRAP